MWIDKQNRFSDAQAVTSTDISANVIDTTYAGTAPLRDLGEGQAPLYLVVATETACTDSGSDATLTVTLESSAAVGLSASTVHFSTGAIAFANFKDAGTRLCAVALPKGDYKQYLGVRYTVGSGPLTAGKFDAFLTTDVQNWKPYKRGSPA